MKRVPSADLQQVRFERIEQAVARGLVVGDIQALWPSLTEARICSVMDRMDTLAHEEDVTAPPPRPRASVSGYYTYASSRFRGVRGIRPGAWTASIFRGGKSIHLGTFDSEVAAGEAYRTAVAACPPDLARPGRSRRRTA